MSVTRFTARFDSRCSACDGDIEAGDDAGYIDDEVCCPDCCDEHDDRLSFG